MAEDNYARTEPASERRLAQARAGGDVPRSSDLVSLLVLAVLVAGLAWWGASLFSQLQHLIAAHFRSLSQFSAMQFNPEPAFSLLHSISLLMLPFLLALFLVGLLASMLLSGWVFAPQAMQFRSERLNPLLRMLRMFSAHGLFDGSKALLIWLVAGGVLVWFFQSHLDDLAGLPVMPLGEAVALTGEMLLKSLSVLLVAAFLAALLDAPWQWWRYLKNLAMTRAEVLAESREAEGNPEFKAKLLRAQSLKAQLRARQAKTRQGRA